MYGEDFNPYTYSLMDSCADHLRPGQGYFDDQLPGEVAALAGRTPDQILARIQEVAVEFCQGKVRDDITMLALRVVEPPGTRGPSGPS